MYRLPCIFSLLEFARKGFHMLLSCHVMGFSRGDSIFSLALPFAYRFHEIGFLIRFMWDCCIGFKAKWAGSPDLETHGLSGP